VTPPVGRGRGARRLAVALGVVAAVVVGYVGVTFVQVWLATDDDDPGPADALVVLGAAQWDGRPSPVFQRRLDHAADLWVDGVAPRIVVTGGKQAGDRVTQGFAAYDYLRNRGVPDEALLVEVNGTDTYTELSASAGILRAAGVGNEVILVTDGYHGLRTRLVAEEVGLDAGVSVASEGARSSQLVRETAAVAAGRLVGFRRLSNWT
jgi:uncharacterized SAM-binding protein YcdF (DUF218 family)